MDKVLSSLFSRNNNSEIPKGKPSVTASHDEPSTHCMQFLHIYRTWLISNWVSFATRFQSRTELSFCMYPNLAIQVSSSEKPNPLWVSLGQSTSGSGLIFLDNWLYYLLSRCELVLPTGMLSPHMATINKLVFLNALCIIHIISHNSETPYI